MDGFDHILNWKLKAGSHPFPGRDGGTCINEAALIAAGFEYRPIRRVESAGRDVDRVVLDHRVGEKLAAHRLDPPPRRFGIGVGEIELDELSLPHLGDVVEAEGGQRMLHRLTLRIEDARL